MVLRDDILEFAINRPIRMEQAYEDRIAALRSEIDRINSRQLLDQDAFETKIGQLLIRQEDLRKQETHVAGLLAKAGGPSLQLAAGTDAAATSTQLGGDLVSPATRSPGVDALAVPSSQPATPHPIEETPLRSSWLSGGDPSRPGRSLDRHSAPGIALARIETDINRMHSATIGLATSLTGLAETHTRAIERVIDRLGLRMAEAEPPPAPKPKPIAATDPERGVGGPLVPILDEGAILTRADAALTRLNQLKEGIGLLPLGQPIHGTIEVTSPFGERPDPFLGIQALHTGVDFRAGMGDPVIATGAGVVTEASRQGGYGNMVEIDHGNGIATRYGHLSQFAVVVGQKVKPGHIIGYVGSTGRSTAPHIHYETRVNGVAVNPESYLQAGNQLRPLLN